MIRVLLFILLTISLQAKEISIALAANMSFAIDELISNFQKNHPDTKVKYTIGGSGKLTSQIQRGAPFDLFLSANIKYPQILYKEKIALNKPVIYAKGSLALFSRSPRDLSNGLNTLKSSNIKRVAMANPKTAPYGVAAKEALENAKLYHDIKSKLVYGESISQTVAYATSATDMGIIAKSALFSPKLKMFKKDKNWVDIDSKLYTPISQGMVLLKESKDTKDFFNYLQTDEAKEILKRYGYIVE